jgi:hypothetical protein
MNSTNASSTLNLGFLTVLKEANGYVGGYLVTNCWGRPLEFRLSTAVKPNRVQQILYAGTLEPYVCADLIGKALIDKMDTPVQLLITDLAPVLELRGSLEVPVAWLPSPDEAPSKCHTEIRPTSSARSRVFCHSRFPTDASGISEKLDRLDGVLDLTEPFLRIRDAIAEARGTGVASRG